MKVFFVLISFLMFCSISFGSTPLLFEASTIKAECEDRFRANEPEGNVINKTVTVTSSVNGGSSSDGTLYLSDAYQENEMRHTVKLMNYGSDVQLSYGGGGMIYAYTKVTKPKIGKIISIVLHHA